MTGRLTPIVIKPQPSRRLGGLLLCLQFLTLTVLLAAPIPIGARLSLLVALMVQSLLSHYRLRGAYRHRITRFRIDDELAARLFFVDGRSLVSRVRGDSLITPWLVLLRFEGGSFLRRPTLLLGPDSLAEEEMRRLRILLRFGRAEKTQPSQ